MYYFGSPNNVGQDPPLFGSMGDWRDGWYL